MIWFTLLNGTGIGCENGRCLYCHNGAWYVRDDNSGPHEVVDSYALALLAALGKRWDGKAIVDAVPVAKAEPATAVMRCYATDGTEYPAERWEECHAKWQEGMWFADFSSKRSGILCEVGLGSNDDQCSRASGPTIRAAFCDATTAYHRKARP